MWESLPHWVGADCTVEGERGRKENGDCMGEDRVLTGRLALRFACTGNVSRTEARGGAGAGAMVLEISLVGMQDSLSTIGCEGHRLWG